MPLCISLDLRCVRTIQEIILRLYNHIIIIYTALGGDELNMQKRIASSYCCFVEPPSFNGLFTSIVFTVLAMNSGTSHEYILRIHVHVMVLPWGIMYKILNQWTLIEVIELLCFLYRSSDVVWQLQYLDPVCADGFWNMKYILICRLLSPLKHYDITVPHKHLHICDSGTMISDLRWNVIKF